MTAGRDDAGFQRIAPTSHRSTDPASNAGQERILLLECRLEQRQSQLESARAEADLARTLLAEAAAREADHARRYSAAVQELAEARAEIASLHRRLEHSEALRAELEGLLFEQGAREDAEELIRLRRELLIERHRANLNERAAERLRERVEELRASRDTILSHLAEWQELVRRDGPEAVDLARYMSDLRREILDLESRHTLAERREAVLRRRLAMAGIDPDDAVAGRPERAADHAPPAEEHPRAAKAAPSVEEYDRAADPAPPVHAEHGREAEAAEDPVLRLDAFPVDAPSPEESTRAEPSLAESTPDESSLDERSFDEPSPDELLLEPIAAGSSRNVEPQDDADAARSAAEQDEAGVEPAAELAFDVAPADDPEPGLVPDEDHEEADTVIEVVQVAARSEAVDEAADDAADPSWADVDFEPAAAPEPTAEPSAALVAMPELVAALESADVGTLRTELRRCLQLFGEEAVLDAIRPSTGSADAAVRAAAYEALGLLLARNPAALEPFMRAGLNDPDGRVRRRVVLAAAGVPGLPLRSLLEPVRVDRDPRVRRVALEVLRHVQPVAGAGRRPAEAPGVLSAAGPAA